MMPYTVRPLDPWIGKYTPGRRASHHGQAQHRPGPTHQREREMTTAQFLTALAVTALAVAAIAVTVVFLAWMRRRT